MNRMRKPEPKLGPDQQDKHSRVLLVELDFERWLYCTVAEAQKLVQFTPAEVFAAGPA